MRNALFCIVSLCTIIMFQDSFAARPYVAQVVKIRGKVTRLRPGAIHASRLKLSDKLREDSSILTGPKSFVRIQFKDGSVLSLGPSSKMVVSHVPAQGASIVSLLKGGLRSKVTPSERSDDPDTKSKFFVRTRTAAMGVRGTEFQTIYNPENKNTSLLTYKGNVALVDAPSDSKFKVKAAKHGPPKLEAKSPDVLEDALKKSDAVEVKAGQYAGVSTGLEKSSKPVQISPDQLNSLYENDDFKEKSEEQIREDAKLEKVEGPKTKLQVVKQDAPLEGFYDKKTGDFAPKSGGYLDMKTGMYVPPVADSALDEKKGVYVAKDIGIIDKKTGQYIPPEGLKLDSKKGFIVKKNGRSAEEEQKLASLQTKMNSSMGKDLILAPKAKSAIDYGKYLSKREILTKDSFQFSLYAFSQDLDVSGIQGTSDPISGSRSYKSPSSRAFELIWNHASGTSWQPIMKISIKSVDFSDEPSNKSYGEEFNQGSNKLFSMALGARYYLNNRASMVGHLEIDQEHYAQYAPEDEDTDDTLELQMVKVAVPKLRLGLEYMLYEKKRFSIESLIGAVVSGRKEKRNFRTNSGYGYFFDVGGKYTLSKRYWTQLSLKVSKEFQNIENPYFEAESERTNGGILLQAGAAF